jgi:hypothetical protein|tara:strand:+ start:648 stop:845 length:198 start_codon:yes stop_codon:yes gene_type:complete
MDMNLEREYCIDNMSETLMQCLQTAADNDNIDDMKAVYSEWIVDERDPEDGKYEFIFLNNFTLQN